MLRFHFRQNRPLNRMKSLGILAFDHPRGWSKVAISTLPALKPAQAGWIWKTAVFRHFRPFPEKVRIQAALAYTSDKTGQDVLGSQG